MRTQLAGRATLLALATMAVLLLGAAPAEAQSDATSTLVSNTGQTATTGLTSVDTHWIGTAFTTGSHTAGYTISEVDVQIGTWGGNSASFTVNIYSTNASKRPDSLLYTLTNPGSPADNAVNTFEAPMGATLDASTTYAIVLKSSPGKTVSVPGTESDDEDPGAATGWSIADGRVHSNNSGNSWGTDARVLMFAVKGAEAVAPPGPEVSSATVDGNTLEIVFDDNLMATSKPTGDAFLVTRRGEQITVSTVGIADATVTLTLGSAVSATDTVLLYYTQPSANALQNAAGHKTASFSRQAVTNNTGSARPELTGVALVSKPRHQATGDASKQTYPVDQPIVVEVTWDQDVTWDVSAAGAELRVRLDVGGVTRLAKLVTDGADSGTARSLWFSYTVVSGDTDTDGVRVIAAGSGDLVIPAGGATLKNGAGRNAKRENAGLGTQAGHKVDGSAAAVANTAPTRDENNLLGSINMPVGTLIQAELPFADSDGDPLRLTLSWVNDVYPLDKPLIIGGWIFADARPDCVLANLPGVTSMHSEVITVTATDPDGASVSDTLTTVTGFVCPSFSSAEVNRKTLTLTLDGSPSAALWAPADEVLAASEFTVKSGSSAVAVEAVEVDGSSATLTLAEAVAVGSSVTLSYAPGDYPAAVAFTDETVTNNTVQPGVKSAEAAYADGRTTLTLTFDRELGAVAAPEPWDLRYAFSVDGLYADGNRYVGVIPHRIETNGKELTLVSNALMAPPGRAVTVRYDEPWATEFLPTVLLYADGEKVASFARTATRPTDGTAVAPLLESAQVAGNVLTLTFDGALDATSAPAGSRFRVRHLAWDWEGPVSDAVGTGTAAISGSTVMVTLASKVPQGSFAMVRYRRGDDAKPLRGVSNGPEVADIWFEQITVFDKDAPQLTGSQLVGTGLVLYYDDTLDTGSTPATGSYTVETAGNNPQTVTVSGVSVHPNAVELTLDWGTTTPGDVTVTYTPGSSFLRDVAGNGAEALTKRSVSRQASDPGAPQFSAASAAAEALTVSLTQSLDPAHVPGPSAFTLSLTNTDLAGDEPTVTGVAVLGSDVELAMSPWWYPCDGSLNVTYAKPTAAASRLQNNWGTEADAFTQPATNTGKDICVFMEVEGSVQVGGQSGGGPVGQSGGEPRNRSRSTLRFDRALDPDSVPGRDAFTVTTRTPGAAPVEVTDVELPDGADDRLLLSLSRHLAGGEQVAVSYRRPHGASGLWDAQGNQVADFSVEVTDPGGAPVFNGASPRLDNALPGILVSLRLRQSDFSDPDGDALTFTLSASRDDVYALGAGVPGGFAYSDLHGRVFFLAKTACALADLDPPDGDAYYTVVTMTATDPGGATAQATATFRTDPATLVCPSLSSATVDGAAVTMVFDGDLAPSYAEPTAADFVVEADGVAVGVAAVSLADGAAGSDSGNTISLTLASPVSAGQSVAVSYAPAHSPVVAAFSDLPAANHTPYELDQQLVADVWGYARETNNGYVHVLRWMRVLETFGVLEAMTAAEAHGYADIHLAARWDPVAEELGQLEAQDGHQPDQQVVAAVRGYARETQSGFDHVLRWMRVLKTFGALEGMTAAEAQGHADQGWPRWIPVAAALAGLEATTP